MAKHKNRFRYSISVDNLDEMYGVWNFKSFGDRDSAMAYAESLAENNAELSVTVDVEARRARKNILRRR